jgi:hypothetical protein
MFDGRKYEIFIEMRQHNGMVFTKINFFRKADFSVWRIQLIPDEKHVMMT